MIGTLHKTKIRETHTIKTTTRKKEAEKLKNSRDELHRRG